MTDDDPSPVRDDSNTPQPGQGDFFVVGLGASAGGIVALREFFRHVNTDTGMAYVVVLHLSAQHESNLPAILQTRTSLPVTQVTEAVKVEPNHVYVIPPSKYLMMLDGAIRLTEPERFRGSPTSIDLFFRTLADAYGKDAIAILLSGSGADGTIGLGRVKEQGGFVVVQDPAEAEHKEMPQSAIASGLVDLVLPVAEIPGKLLAIRDSAIRLQLSEGQEQEEPEIPAPFEPDETALRNVLALLRLRTGNDFAHYRRPTLLRRIARRMQVHELHQLSHYLDYLRERPDEVLALLKDLLITVTNFFRDPDAFEFLQSEVVPQLFADKSGNDQVRVWTAGCATGEEAYSIAILLAEHASRLSDPPKIQVFATDIDEQAIAVGRAAQYPETIALDVSPTRLRQFFNRNGDRYQLKKEIRDTVLFASHNVLRDPPFSKLDLVSCRNLLIYLNHAMQEQVIQVFHFALLDDGYLFLGASESAENSLQFTPFDKKRRIYRRRAMMGANAGLSPALLSGRWRPPLTIPDAREPRPHNNSNTPGQLHQEIVEQLAPPSVLVNEDYEIVHSSANAGRYMRISGGEPSQNLLKLVFPEIRLDLRAALLEAAANSGVASTSRRLCVVLEGEQHWLSMNVRRVSSAPSAAVGFFLVIFDESSEAPSETAAASRRDGENLEIVRDLEQELQRTKDQLRLTIEQNETSTEELRASNEELQAINEELRSATEELETGKEELQSVNEELTTLNQEYREKIEEVGRANSDLQNLMSSIDIATIFLDRALQIKRYTPKAQALFNIIAADIGRPLEHFTHKLEYGEIHADAEGVLRTLQTMQRQVRSNDGEWYLARLTPYRTLDDKIDGVVLTFVDITETKRFEEQLKAQTSELTLQAEILNLANVMILDRERRILLWKAGCERLYGYTVDEAVGQLVSELLRTEFPCSQAEINESLERTGQWQGELVHTTKTGRRLVIASHWIAHQRSADEPPVILEVNTDVTALRIAEQAAVDADHNKDLFLATLAHELRNPLSAMSSGVEILAHLERDDGKLSPAVGILRRQFASLARMVDDLLDTQRLTQGKIDLRIGVVAADEIARLAIETIEPIAAAKRHQVNVSLPHEQVFIRGDAMRLGQIVANLLDNACKYTDAGGRIDLMVERDARQVLFRVRDNGIGISAEILPRIFDNFFQAQPDLGSKGLGIGLALARRLAEMQNGTIAAQSEGLGKGSEFTVRIPIAPKPSRGTAEREPRNRVVAPPEPSKQTRKVLLVDDDSDSTEAMAVLLQIEGHQTRTANRASSALEIAREFTPEIAVLDIGLPEIDGYALGRSLRDLLPDVVLIALSGWGVDVNDPRSREAGFNHCFTKPIDPNNLRQVLAEVPSPAK